MNVLEEIERLMKGGMSEEDASEVVSTYLENERIRDKDMTKFTISVSFDEDGTIFTGEFFANSLVDAMTEAKEFYACEFGTTEDHIEIRDVFCLDMGYDEIIISMAMGGVYEFNIDTDKMSDYQNLKDLLAPLGYIILDNKCIDVKWKLNKIAQRIGVDVLYYKPYSAHKDDLGTFTVMCKRFGNYVTWIANVYGVEEFHTGHYYGSTDKDRLRAMNDYLLRHHDCLKR